MREEPKKRTIEDLERITDWRFRDVVGEQMRYPAVSALGQPYLHEFTHSELIGALIEYLGVKVTPRPAIGGRAETCKLEGTNDQK